MALPPERAAEICGVPAEQIARGRALLGTGERLVSTCAAGRLPVKPGDGRRRPGQQHQSSARHDRQTGLRASSR